MTTPRRSRLRASALLLPCRAAILAAAAKPDFGAAPAAATLLRVELLQSTTVTLTTR